MTDLKFELLGKAHHNKNIVYYFFKDQFDRIYIYDDEQKIIHERYLTDYIVRRIVSRTVFFGESVITLIFKTEEEKALLKVIQQELPKDDLDPSFLDFVKFFENSNLTSDLGIFNDCESITRKILLQNFDEKVHGGEVPGCVQYYLIEAVFKSYSEIVFSEGRLFLQIVYLEPDKSGMVEHQEMTPQLYHFANLPEIKKIVKADTR